MPLNISIDVDGTILDENEALVPQARESIQRLKDAGHCLQLWSGGGAEYAEMIARKFNLTDLFDSYAKKIDVAIDDLPETAHPLAVIHVDREHRLDQAVEASYWFAELRSAFETLHCPYYFAAAHIDVTPWTTYAPTTLVKKDRNLLRLYNQLLDDGVENHLPKVLKFCKDTVKLIVICSSDEPKREEAKRLPIIKQTIRRSLSKDWNGEIFIMPKSQISEWAWGKHRDELIRLLDLGNVFP